MKIINRYTQFGQPNTNFRRYDKVQHNQEIITSDLTDTEELRHSFVKFSDDLISILKLYQFSDFIPCRPKYFVYLIQDPQLNYNYFYEFYVEIERSKIFFNKEKNDFFNYALEFLKDSNQAEDYITLEMPLDLNTGTLINFTCLFPKKNILLVDENDFIIDKKDEKARESLLQKELEIINNIYKLLEQYLSVDFEEKKESLINEKISSLIN